MMNRILHSRSIALIAAILVIIPLLLTSNTLSVYAKQHNETEIKALIESAQSKLNDLKAAKDADSFNEEISRIESYLQQAQKSLEENNLDMSYYAASIADSCFALVDAKREYVESQKNTQ